MRKLLVLVGLLLAGLGGTVAVRNSTERKAVAARDSALQARRDSLQMVAEHLTAYKEHLAEKEHQLDSVRAQSDAQALIAVITRRRASFDLGKVTEQPFAHRPIRINGTGPPRAAVQFAREAAARTPLLVIDDFNAGQSRWTCSGKLLDVDAALKAAPAQADRPAIPPAPQILLPWNRAALQRQSDIEREIAQLRKVVGEADEISRVATQIDTLLKAVDGQPHLAGLVPHAERLLLDRPILQEASFKPREDGRWTVVGRLAKGRTALDVTKAFGMSTEVSFNGQRVELVAGDSK